jgi:hypothetical protein
MTEPAMNAIDELQQSLMKMLNSIGKYKTEQKKESVHVLRERAFLGIHPKKSYLGLNLVLNHDKTSPPADKVEQVSANRYHHCFKITETKQLSGAFGKLLKEAYDFAEPKEAVAHKAAGKK